MLKLHSCLSKKILTEGVVTVSRSKRAKIYWLIFDSRLRQLLLAQLADCPLPSQLPPNPTIIQSNLRYQSPNKLRLCANQIKEWNFYTKQQCGETDVKRILLRRHGTGLRSCWGSRRQRHGGHGSPQLAWRRVATSRSAHCDSGLFRDHFRWQTHRKEIIHK